MTGAGLDCSPVNRPLRLLLISEQPHDANIELRADLDEHASDFRNSKAERFPYALGYLFEDVLSSAIQPARGRCSMRAVQRSDLIDAERFDVV